jgi:hypothetical protein
MASEPQPPSSVEMPRPTVAPMVLSLGMVLLASGMVFGTAFAIVGAIVLAIGLGLWIGHLLPGQGHLHEPLVEPAARARPVPGQSGTVERLAEGMPGYRFQLPERIHPISAGVLGGLVGGLVLPLPALLWGVLSGHGILYPVNLLAGMVLPGVGNMTDQQLMEFRPTLLLVGLIIHAIISVTFGLIYGVLLPMLPPIPRPIAWGGLLLPLLWTAVTFATMEVINPVLRRGVDWPWFIFSQFIFGVVAAIVVLRAGRVRPIVSGLLGGLVGGLLMTIPALLWGLLSGHGIWYPVNLLAAMVIPGMSSMPLERLREFHVEWLMAAVCIHAVLSLGFGMVYGLLLPKLREIPGPLAWGGLLMPLLWTGISYGLMGIVNPVLQQRVDWPWFIGSQFLFGVVASIVVLRSETIPVPPRGPGPVP